MPRPEFLFPRIYKPSKELTPEDLGETAKRTMILLCGILDRFTGLIPTITEKNKIENYLIGDRKVDQVLRKELPSSSEKYKKAYKAFETLIRTLESYTVTPTIKFGNTLTLNFSGSREDPYQLSFRIKEQALISQPKPEGVISITFTKYYLGFTLDFHPDTDLTLSRLSYNNNEVETLSPFLFMKNVPYINVHLRQNIRDLVHLTSFRVE